MTKPVTAIGILILMEEGKLALNDAVEKYLPEFQNSAFLEHVFGSGNESDIFMAMAATL